MREYNVDLKLVKELEAKAYKIRYDLLNFIYRIGMGHLGGELSMVEVAVALYYHYLNYDPKNPKWEERDRFILSKGHCSETLYTIFADLGMYTQDYMVEHFETLETAKFGMHSNRKYCEAIELSAGSLGHGLPVAVGMALGARMQRKNWRVFVMVGDGELMEGSNWEAIMAGAHHQLGNLVAIVDKNGLSMTGFTREVINIDPLDKRLESFGWEVHEFDGNDMYAVCNALQNLPPSSWESRRKPIFLIANTTKGRDVSFMENKWNWHGGGIAKDQLEEALQSIKQRYEQRKGVN